MQYYVGSCQAAANQSMHAIQAAEVQSELSYAHLISSRAATWPTGIIQGVA